MDKTLSDTAFYDQLLRFSQEFNAKDRSQIEQNLWDEYGAEISVLVVDMSGFTRLTELHGIVHYLSMIQRMQLTAQPIVESYGGKIVKFDADNAFACFDLPGSAIRAGIALNLALDSANILTPDELDARVSCGIDHGKCLFPNPSDYYGGPVNRASKLGEDLVEPGQILVTEEAMSLVSESLNIQTVPIGIVLGGKKVIVHSVIYRHGDAT